MELYDLKILLEISKHSTLKEAANVLFLSQSSLSKSIDRLEADLGIKLFSKNGNKLILNEKGKYVVEKAREIIEKTNILKEDVLNGNNSKNSFNIGACSFASRLKLTKLFYSVYPNFMCLTEIKPCHELIDNLYNGVYDMIILPYKPDDSLLKSCLLFDDHYCIVVPKNHKLSEKKEIDIIDLNGEKIIMHQCYGYFLNVIKNTLKKSIITMYEDYFDFCDMCEYTNLPFINSSYTISIFGNNFNRAIIPLCGEGSRVNYYLVCLNKNFVKYEKIFTNIGKK